MEKRSLEEATIDRLLLLYVVATTREKGYNILDDIKLQKILYKTQERMNEAKCKGLNYNFVRREFGPFSQEIYSDVEDLKKTGFLMPEEVASPSEKGRLLLRALDSVFDRETKDSINKVLDEFGPYTGSQIKAIMGGLPVVGKMKTIEEAEIGEILLTKLNKADAEKCICLNETTFDTLRFLFDPNKKNPWRLKAT